MNLNPSEIYKKYDDVIKYIKFDRLGPLDVFTLALIKARLFQKIIELTLPLFVLQAHNNNRGMQIKNSKFISLYFDGNSLKISPPFFLYTRTLISSIYHSFRCIFFFFICSFRISSAKQSAALIYGIPDKDIFNGDSDREFRDYCKNCEIPQLKHCKRIEVASLKQSMYSNSSYISYSQEPLFNLLKKNPPNIIDFFKFLFRQFYLYFVFFSMALRNPVLIFIFKDIIFFGIVEYLDKYNLIEAIFITNSNYNSQPLWMRRWSGRKFNTYMLWYSENIIPFSFKKYRESYPYPVNRHIAVDGMMVWTDYFKKYLQDIGIKARINVVNPILWYLDKYNSQEKKNELNILIFDVTPYSKNYLAAIGHWDGYYSLFSCTEFIRSILDVVSELERNLNIKINLKIKAKRGYNKNHDHDYIRYLNKLIDDGFIKNAMIDDNIYTLIRNSDLAIVMPFSSPAIIADYIGKVALYFDPVEVLVPQKNRYSNLIKFCSGSKELQSSITNFIKTHK
jgi:polysaccharide biosynthesis PFTS motif protein